MNPKFVIIRTLFTLFVNMMNVLCKFIVIDTNSMCRRSAIVE